MFYKGSWFNRKIEDDEPQSYMYVRYIIGMAPYNLLNHD